MITCFKTENFKSIKSLIMPLGNVTAIYGGNGTGKSNVLKAFGAFAGRVTGRKTPVVPFFGHEDEPTLFSADFLFGDEKLSYEIEVLDGKIVSEALVGTNDVIFKDMSDAAFIKNANEETYRFFETVLCSSEAERVHDEKDKGNVLELLSCFGLSVRDINYAEEPIIRHGDRTLKFHEESKGFRRIFGLCEDIGFVFRSGGFLVVDDLDTHVHPYVQERIIEIFSDPGINVNGARLMFSTHDPYLMDHIAPETVYFAHYDDGTWLSCLPLRDDKFGNNYANKYLKGRYGGVPELRKARFLFN